MTNLQRIRKEKGLSQSQLAKVSNINVRTIQHYESEYRDINNIKAISLYKLANALECDMIELLELEPTEKTIEDAHF